MLLCGGGEKRETGERDGRNVAAGFVACVCGVVACTCEWLLYFAQNESFCAKLCVELYENIIFQ